MDRKIRKWTQEAILTAYNQFIEQHDRLPTKQEVIDHTDSLPLPRIIRLNMGMTLKEFIHTYYSTYEKMYNGKTRNFWIEQFKTRYIELGYLSEDDYNRVRDKGAPSTKTMRLWHNDISWSDFLNIYGINRKKHTKYVVQIIEPDYDNTEAIQEFITKINKFLENITV